MRHWLDDLSGMEELEHHECIRLLATQIVGRVGLVVEGRPLVMPVNYVADGATIVFRTAQGSMFDRAVRGAEVAFEIDHADPGYHSGWSVIGRGRAEPLADDRVHTDHLDFRLRPWARHDPPGWIQVRFELLTGRRIVQLPVETSPEPCDQEAPST